MNILVLNGSPKEENSITLQTLRYLEKKFHIENMQVLPVGQRIKALEKDFSPALEAIEKADLLPPRSPPPSISMIPPPTATFRTTSRKWVCTFCGVFPPIWRI